MAETLDWTMPRAEDRARWWVRDQLYTLVPRTPLSDSVMTVQWDEAVLCVADVLKFPDSRGFNARTLNGYTYLSPMTITDPAVIEQRLGQFFGNVEALAASVEQDLAAYAAEQDADEAHWQAKDFAAETNPMILLEHWRRSLVSLDRAWKMHFLIVFPRHVVAGMVEHGAHDWAGITAAHEIGKLTRAHGETRQMELDRGLWRLARAAIDLGLGDILLSSSEDDLLPALRAALDGPRWLADLDAFLQVFGHRMMRSFELNDPTWAEDPTPVLGTLRAYVAQGGTFDFARLEAEALAEREAAEAAALARIADPANRQKFARTLGSARAFQRAMEDDNFPFLRANARPRYIALAIGQMLARGGALDRAEDVFFLRRAEMEAALTDLATGMYPVAGWADVARKARGDWERWCAAVPPAFLGDLPDVVEDFMINQFWGIKGKAQLEESGNAVSGLGASAGLVEGIARIVRGPDEFGQVLAGEIVVCRSTNPAWTPLFTKIAGIVTDQGGTLSHAAVVAREYGIPAVLGTIHATARIPDGARVRIDGAAGKIEIL